ncbi:MAG: penicillin-binding protein 2 [bacterium]
MYTLQIDKGASFSKKVAARDELAEHQVLRRGQILFTDKNGANIQVALNKEFSHIVAIPKEIIDATSTAKLLAPIVEIDEARLASAFSDKSSLYYSLVDKASSETVDAIKALNIKGIDFRDTQYRYYPFESLAAQLLGFVGKTENNPEAVGLYGIEKLDDTKLTLGEDIQLTIDRNLQAESERILSKLITEHSAEGGTIIIQDPKTGKILALASAPSFDPNVYGKSSYKNFLNPAVQAIYEPGSVFKPLTMVAGIDSGIFTPDTTYVDTGHVTLNGKTVTNWDHSAHGKITMTGVIEDSVNTGAIWAEQKIGRKTFYDYLKKFGLGEYTSIDLPDEVSGSLSNLERKNAQDIDYATASYGQGTSVTPVQLVSAFSAIANGGLLMRPYIHASGEPYVVRRVMSGETATKVTKMMESAVIKNILAAIPQYRIAGKTGTAFIPENGKYSMTDLIHSYMGFAPAEDAKFVILMKLEKPDKPLAGQTVVPKFKELAQFVLNYYNIPPDALVEATSTKSQ